MRKLLLASILFLNIAPCFATGPDAVAPSVQEEKAIEAAVAEMNPAVMPEAELSPAAQSMIADEVTPSEVASGEEAEPVPVPVDPNLTFLQLLLKSIGDAKGATTLAIVGIVIQLLLKLLDLPMLGNFFSGARGNIKLLIVGFLTFALTPITLVQTLSLDWGAALTHTATLTAFMVLFNQIYIQFFKKDA